MSKIPWSISRDNVLGRSDLFVFAMAYADFDADGFTDIAMAPGNLTEHGEPIRIFRGTRAGNFIRGTSGIIPGDVPVAVHARKALVADFNADGMPDLYIADHGYDQPPFPGSTNLLLLSDGAGHLVYAAQHQEPVGFHHGASAADIDLDGDVDIFVCDDHRWPMYFLINDGSGSFQRETGRAPRGLHGKSAYSAELIDVDEDGFVDLLVGGHEFDGLVTSIYWGDGSGSFRHVSHTELPAVLDFGVVLDFDAEDLDRDGDRDLVITRAASPPQFYEGYYFQVLMQCDSRIFVDQSMERIIGDELSWMGRKARWIDWIRLIDVDGDADLDILLDDAARGLGWLNDGSGFFSFYVP
jgi:hypothetical protein